MTDIPKFLLKHPYFTSSMLAGVTTATDFALKVAPTNEIATQYAIPVGLFFFGLTYLLEKLAVKTAKTVFPRVFTPGHMSQAELKKLLEADPDARTWSAADLALYQSSKKGKAVSGQENNDKWIKEWQKSIGMKDETDDK